MWNFTASALSPLSFLHLPRNLCGVDHPAGLTSRPGEPIQQLSYGDFSGKWGKDLQERKHRVRSLFSLWPLCSESPLLCSESKGLSTRAPFLQRQSFYLTQAHITHMCHSIQTKEEPGWTGRSVTLPGAPNVGMYSRGCGAGRHAGFCISRVAYALF